MVQDPVFSDGPDPMISGKPDCVRVRLTAINQRILITLEATWTWDPAETRRKR